MNISISPELELRLRQPEDAQAIFELIDKNREYLREWLPWVDGVVGVDDTKKYIEGCLNVFEKKTGVDFGIWYEGKWIGSVGSNRMDSYNKKAEIGYWIGQEHAGRGIVTRGVEALVNYLFEEFDMNRIEIRTAVENARSSAIPEKLGFTYEGTLRQAEFINGRFLDSKVYSFLRSDRTK